MDLPEERGERRDAALMRASDADRDRIADLLREALAEGRLSPDEHAERLDAVFRAKTYAELTPLVEDLPSARRSPGTAPAPADPPAPAAESPSILTVFSSTTRRGRWLVEPVTNATTIFGDAELDLRQAVLSQREVTINMVAIFSAVKIRVPPGVLVINSVTPVLSSCQLPPEELTADDAPVVRLTGLALCSSVEVKRGDGAAGPRLEGLMREIDRERRRQRRELRHGNRRERREGA